MYVQERRWKEKTPAKMLSFLLWYHQRLCGDLIY